MTYGMRGAILPAPHVTLAPVNSPRRWINHNGSGYHFVYTLVMVFKFAYFGIFDEGSKMNDASERLGNKAAATIIDPESHPSGTVITVSPWRAAVRARWALIVMISGMSVYAVLAVLAHHYAYFDWDLSIARYIQSINFPGFRTLMIASAVRRFAQTTLARSGRIPERAGSST